jgi:hypothetical protein
MSVRILLRQGGRYTTLCDKVCQWLASGLLFSPGTSVSSTNKTDSHDITKILLKVALNTIINTHPYYLTRGIYTKLNNMNIGKTIICSYITIASFLCGVFEFKCKTWLYITRILILIMIIIIYVYICQHYDIKI